MEHAADFPLPKIFQKPCTYFDIVNFYVVHMCIMRTFFWNIRLLDLSFFGKELQIFIVKIINLHSLVTDLLMLFQLSIKIRRIQLTWKIGGTVIHPPVFIYLSAEKLAAVRSLFSEDLRLLLVLVLIKQDRAAFSHSIVLRLMEAVAAKIPDSSKRFSFIVGIHTLSRIFHNFALKLVSVSLGAIIYYIVIQLVLTLGFDANLLKLLSASVVAVFLAVPYWKSKYFAKPAAKKAQKEDAKNA